MTDEQLYRRAGRRYRPVRPFEGFPSKGVFLVTDEREVDGHLVGVSYSHLGEIPPAAALDRAALEPHRAAAQRAVQAAFEREKWRMRAQYAGRDLWLVFPSVHELVSAVFEAIAAGGES